METRENALLLYSRVARTLYSVIAAAQDVVATQVSRIAVKGSTGSSSSCVRECVRESVGWWVWHSIKANKSQKCKRHCRHTRQTRCQQNLGEQQVFAVHMSPWFSCATFINNIQQ